MSRLVEAPKGHPVEEHAYTTVQAVKLALLNQAVRWDLIQDEFMFAAQDDDGTWYAYSARPKALDTQWVRPLVDQAGNLSLLSRLLPPQCPAIKDAKSNWASTLQERPEWMKAKT